MESIRVDWYRRTRQPNSTFLSDPNAGDSFPNCSQILSVRTVATQYGDTEVSRAAVTMSTSQHSKTAPNAWRGVAPFHEPRSSGSLEVTASSLGRPPPVVAAPRGATRSTESIIGRTTPDAAANILQFLLPRFYFLQRDLGLGRSILVDSKKAARQLTKQKADDDSPAPPRVQHCHPNPPQPPPPPPPSGDEMLNAPCRHSPRWGKYQVLVIRCLNLP